MTTHVVGIGEMVVSTAPGDVIRALALGSCIAVIMLDPQSHCVGMAHVALPDSKSGRPDVSHGPGMFADKAIPTLLARMSQQGGAAPETLRIKLVGGAAVIALGASFDIGRRNAIAVRRALWTRQLGAIAEDLGGNFGRTVAVDVDFGRVRISSPGMRDWEI